DNPLVEAIEGAGTHVRVVRHPLITILSPDCDLEQDYRARFVTHGNTEDSNPDILVHITVCDAFSAVEIKQRAREWRRVFRNQNERYHRLSLASLELPTAIEDDLFLDFKRTFALPTDKLYDGIASGGVRTLGFI